MLPFDSILDHISGILLLTNVIILTGETGSGKTLRTPQIAYFLGVSNMNKILCTEPRRIAVCNAAKEVSTQLGSKVGSIVGYSVRFEENFSSKTKIKFVTEGILIKEWFLDPSLKNYSTLIIDEAHERSFNTDTILSLVKNQISLNLNLKIILMSATIDSEKFSKFLFDCPVLCIPGRSFSIVSFFSRLTSEKSILNTVRSLFEILNVTKRGNILLFLKGRADIDKVGHILFSLKKFLTLNDDYDIFPIFSEFSTKEQLNLLKDFSNSRKIILATNIAEASITIPHVNFVIDTGLSKFNYFDLKLNQERLTTFPINHLSSVQRSGRTGRTRSGRCYKLYSKWSLRNELGKYISPEIQRIDLCGTLLFFKSFGLKQFIFLNWLDDPPTILLTVALKTLYLIGAINKKNKLTILGRKLAELPLKPMLGKSLVLSIIFNCKNEILYLSCILSISLSKLKFKAIEIFTKTQNLKKGDHDIYFELFEEWKFSGYSYQWCKNNGLNFYDFQVAKNIECQLESAIKKLNGFKHNLQKKETGKALLSGFFLNTAKLLNNGLYRPVFSRYYLNLKIYPESSLNNCQYTVNFILYDHIYINGKAFMKIVTAVKIENIKDLLSTLLNK